MLDQQHNSIASKLVGASVVGDALMVLDACDSLSLEGNWKVNGNEAPSDFASLPGEVVALIVAKTGGTATVARTIGQVCRGWREAILKEKLLLQELHFRTLRCLDTQANLDLPTLVSRALEAGNVQAQVLTARHLRRASAADLTSQRKLWLQAAKRGHSEAQWMVGMGYYYGHLGLHVDSEEALMWLTRAAKPLLQLLDCNDNKMSLPVLMSFEECRTIAAQCCHIIAVMHLDGDSIKQDWSLAIKWFRLAQHHGCKEAGNLLQSLYRNGQY
jgi:hypothetical protein